MPDLFGYDRDIGVELLCGVDEAGRGPLAGDVYAAAVILPSDCVIEGLNDSKKLTEKKREALFTEITQKAVCFSIASASVAEIEEINILNASLLAMQRAVAGLCVRPKLALIDGNRNTVFEGVHSKCLVKGDATSASIAAASILAKVARDRYITEMAELYPGYAFEKHKGYGTELHYQRLRELGASPIHRKSFLKSMDAPKKSPKRKRGDKAEEITCEYLKGKGYTILFRNFSCPFGEIDIIATKGEYICFVEVKALKEGSAILPREQVTKKKQERLQKAMYCWLETNSTDLQPRFDVAEALLSGKGSAVTAVVTEYLENAF